MPASPSAASSAPAFLWGRTNRERKAYTLEFAIWVAENILQSLIERYSQKVNEQSIGYDVPSSSPSFNSSQKNSSYEKNHPDHHPS